jgi:hypothetical protein
VRSPARHFLHFGVEGQITNSAALMHIEEHCDPPDVATKVVANQALQPALVFHCGVGKSDGLRNGADESRVGFGGKGLIKLLLERLHTDSESTAAS